ncbi:hypothetical protein Q0L23_24140 [Klebsiella michiganensis]|uniref:hypothetical protein n=1 Tax=Klebsiella michiganensis TaxID=1134687 RepID=UPI00265A99EC|nr:hypothetical protein [Klebsiella michiganensis]WKJ95538.1 hypothetical protein Q0L46_15220 [Klebsiella michiganensis]WKK02943.1 hypothetical protein Q0L23_24140 [Klebsiella michiganensis]
MKNIQQIENEVDLFYKSLNLTTDIKGLAIWRALTVSEDTLFFALIGLYKKGFGKATPSHLLWINELFENNKIAIKHMLSEIDKQCFDSYLCVYDEIISPEVYTQLSEVYKSSYDYSHICTLFISFHKKLTNIIQQNDEIHFNYNKIDLEYSILHHHLSFEPPLEGKSAFQVLYELIFLDVDDTLIQGILSDTHFEGELINYPHSQKLMCYIYSQIASFYVPVDDGWTFPCFSLTEFRAYFRSLICICIHHTIAVLFNSRAHKIKGGGLEQRVLRINKNLLKDNISKYSGLSNEIIDKITEFLTYGKDVKSPDPALQPLIDVGNEYIIPNYLVITSNFDRNALTLHSRIDEKGFNKTSHLFEVVMTKNILSEINGKFTPLTNLMLPKKEGGEIDLILLDESSKTILICELRWMLQPSDPNEIFNRQKVCMEKVEQAQKKVNAANKHKEHILRMGCCSIKDLSEWSVKGVVILDGYTGVQSDTDIIILPKIVFTKIVEISESLQEVYDFCASYKWLPHTDHFGKINIKKTKFADYTFFSQGINSFDSMHYLKEFLPLSLINHRHGAVVLYKK